MIKLRFIDPTTFAAKVDCDVETCDISWRLNEIEDWSASISANVSGINDIVPSDFIEIYHNGELVFEGVFQLLEQTLDDGNKFKVSGRGILDNLYATRAFSQAYYQDKELVMVVGELLRRANWRLGYINTMADKTIKTTVDLRNEKRIFPQITKAIGGVADTYLRYGGYINGKYAIDIGAFGEESGVECLTIPDGDGTRSFDQDSELFGARVGAIEKISVRENNVEIINSVEAFGGEVTDNTGKLRLIDLGDALGGVPTLATDPDFPIQTLATGIYLVRNNAIATTVGSQSLEIFSQYAPEKTENNATLAACRAAGLALYYRVVAFLKDHAANDVTYDVPVSGQDLYLKIGDTVHIKGTYTNSIVDDFTDDVELLSTTVDEVLRTTSAKVSFAGDTVKWSFSLVEEGSSLTQEDLYVSIYDATKTDTQPTGSVPTPAFPPQFATITQLVSPSASDTFMEDGRSAKLVTLTQAGAPVGSTGIYLAGIPYGTLVAGDLDVELVSDPVFSPAFGTVVRIALKTRGWQYGDTTTLTCHVVWI